MLPTARPHRRTRLRTLVIGTAVCLLAACSSDPAPAEPAAAPAAAGFPVSIEHAFGTTTVEGPAERIVALGFNESDFVLALGEQPVGVRDFIGAFDENTRAWTRDVATGPAPEQVGGEQIDFERIAALQPDLIMAVYAFLEPDDYATLAQIAPTVAAPSAVTTATWQEQTRITGRALGKDTEAEQLVADVEQRFADAAAANPSFAGRTIAVGLVRDESTYVLEPTDLRAQFFTDLGFTNTEVTGEVGAERYGLLDTDVLVALGADRATLTANPVFAQLGVVQENRVYYTGGFDTEFNGALGFGSPLSLPYALDIAVPQLAAATDDDPATLPE